MWPRQQVWAFHSYQTSTDRHFHFVLNFPFCKTSQMPIVHEITDARLTIDETRSVYEILGNSIIYHPVRTWSLSPYPIILVYPVFVPAIALITMNKSRVERAPNHTNKRSGTDDKIELDTITARVWNCRGETHTNLTQELRSYPQDRVHILDIRAIAQTVHQRRNRSLLYSPLQCLLFFI